MPIAECAYCGKVADATDDHVPPQAFFTGELAEQLRTVKSCLPCNNGASLDDEYFLHTVLKYHRVADLPTAEKLVNKMVRAIRNPKKAGYARKTIEAISDVETVTPAGIRLGKQPAFRIQQERLERALCRYVRGLHRYEYGELVPADTPMKMVVNPEAVHLHFDEFQEGFRGASTTTIQEGVFWYARIRPSSRPSSSYWLLVFFNAFPLIAALRPETPFPRAAV